MAEGRKIEKDMIFFIPGKEGPVFTYKAGHVVTDKEIHDLLDFLEFDTENKVAWVEERRSSQRFV